MSWPPGGSVAPDRLRAVDLSHFDFDNRVQYGHPRRARRPRRAPSSRPSTICSTTSSRSTHGAGLGVRGRRRRVDGGQQHQRLQLPARSPAARPGPSTPTAGRSTSTPSRTHTSRAARSSRRRAAATPTAPVRQGMIVNGDPTVAAFAPSAGGGAATGQTPRTTSTSASRAARRLLSKGSAGLRVVACGGVLGSCPTEEPVYREWKPVTLVASAIEWSLVDRPEGLVQAMAQPWSSRWRPRLRRRRRLSAATRVDEPELVAVDAAVADFAVAAGDEPGDGPFDHRPVRR